MVGPETPVSGLRRQMHIPPVFIPSLSCLVFTLASAKDAGDEQESEDLCFERPESQDEGERFDLYSLAQKQPFQPLLKITIEA